LRIADRYGLTGWVRNVADGTVEMLAQGDAEGVNHCLRDIQESFEGYITQTRTRDSSEDTKCANFRITY
jgi:acylphosphatase